MTKLLRRILTLVLVICLTATSFAFTVAADASSDDDNFASQAKLLKDLGILNYNIGKPDDVMNRAQFVDMAIRTYIADLTSVEVAHTFIDVIPNYEFKDSIEAAASAGIVFGDGSGRFGVEEKITTKAAITIMLRILGYEDYIKWHGNFDDIYLSEASKIKLTTGVDLSGENMSFREAVKLICNAIDIAPYEVAAVDDDSISFEKDTDETLISKRLDIYQVEGIVTENRFVSLNGSTPAEKGYVKIDGKSFRVGNTLADDFIGCNVTAYCRLDEPYGTILHIEDNESDLTVIDDETYDGYSNGRLSYYKKNGSKSSISIDPTAIIIYNNALVKGGQFSDSIFDIQNGTIRVIEHSLNNNTVVIINSYNDMIVDRVITADDYILIVDKFNSEDSIYIEDEEMFTIIDENDNTLFASDIASGSVISAAVSFDGTCGKLIVSSKSVNQAYVTLAGDDYVVIKTYNEPAHTYDEVEYKYTAKFKSMDQKDNIVIPSSEYTVYFNVFGDIAYMDLEKDASDFYAYVMGWTSADKTFNHRLKLKLFKSDGKVAEHILAEGVKIDGVKCKGKSVDEICRILGFDSDKKTRLMYISLNFDSEIKDIDTCPEFTDEREADYELYKTDREDKDTIYKIDARKAPAGNSTSYPSTYKYFNATINSFNTGLFISPQTIIMGIPLDSDDDYRFKILTTSSFISGRWYDVEGFSRDDDGIAPDIILFHYYSKYSDKKEDRVESGNGAYATKAFERSLDTDTAFVTKIAKGKDPDTDDIVDILTLTVLRTGAQAVHYIQDSDLLDGIEQGDIVRWFTMGGSLAYLEKLYDLADKQIDPNPRTIKWTNDAMAIPSYFIKQDGHLLTDSSGGENNTNPPQFMIAHGFILNNTDRYLRYVVYDDYMNGNTGNKYQYSAQYTTAKVYTYDSRNNKLNLVGTDRIVSTLDGSANNSEVLLFVKNLVTQAIIIFK